MALHSCADRAGRFALQVAAVDDVVPAAGVQLEAQGDLEERADRARGPAAAAGGRIDAGQQFQQRALAGPVGADDAHPLALVDPQIDAFQGPDLEGVLLAAAEQAVQQILFQADPAVPPHVEDQAHVVQLDQVHQRRRPPLEVEDHPPLDARQRQPWPAAAASSTVPAATP